MVNAMEAMMFIFVDIPEVTVLALCWVKLLGWMRRTQTFKNRCSPSRFRQNWHLRLLTKEGL